MSAPAPEPAPSPPPSPGISGLPLAVAIDAARPRDLLALVRLQKRAFPPRLAYPLGTLVLLWALPWVRLLVARQREVIVGCIIADRVIDGARVINLAVDPAARRQGVGTALLRAVEQEFAGTDITLMVQVENSAARALYHSAGYTDEAAAPNYYGPGRSGIRMRKMALRDRW